MAPIDRSHGPRQNCKLSHLALLQQLHSSTVNVWRNLTASCTLHPRSLLQVTRHVYIRRIGLASSNMGKLDRVWSNRQLSLSSKLRIYNCCILALMLYGSEAWTILKADRQKLQSFHLRCQRRKLQIRWSDFVTNADVSARTSLTDVHSIISQTRHALFGHIRRLPPDTPAHKIGGPPHGSPNAASSFRPDITWRRPPGRSRSTWLQQLTDDIGISASRLWDSAADLSEWAALRPIAGLID